MISLMTPPTRSPFIIKRRSTIHGFGIYARKFIPKGTRIIEYVGERISKIEAERRAHKDLFVSKTDLEKGAVYIFVLNKRYDIDGNVGYNTAKYINHSCDPNCETEIIRGKIWVIALKDILKGDELSYNYGYDLDDYEEHPCRCLTNRCVGFIASEDLWPRLRELIAKKKEGA